MPRTIVWQCHVLGPGAMYKAKSQSPQLHYCIRLATTTKRLYSLPYFTSNTKITQLTVCHQVALFDVSSFYKIGYQNTQLSGTDSTFWNNVIGLTWPTARTAFKLVTKTKRPSLILTPVMDDIFDNAFEYFSEKSEIRWSIRITLRIRMWGHKRIA